MYNDVLRLGDAQTLLNCSPVQQTQPVPNLTSSPISNSAAKSCKVYQHLSVAREPSRISPFPLPLREGVISETHALPRQIGSERRVEARVDYAPLRVQTLRFRIQLRSVHPGATHLLENHHAMPFSPEINFYFKILVTCYCYIEINHQYVVDLHLKLNSIFFQI
ncbi:hypothetical protein AAZX31_01G197100 [Glycine max]